MSIKRILALGVMTAALLAGSAEARQRYARGCDSGDQVASTVVGAVIGGVIGGQFGNGGDDRAIGAVAGALLGGAAGNRIGASNCDQSYSGGYDQQPYAGGYDQAYQPGYDPDEAYSGAQYGGYDESPYYDNAFETAAPNQRVRWDDPDSGNYGYVRPADWYQDESGNDCRAFEQTIYIDGRAQRATGTACREPDGSWRIVE